MKAEIIARLNELLITEDVFKAQKEFKQLVSQFKSLQTHLVDTDSNADDDADFDDHHHEDDDAQVESQIQNDSPSQETLETADDTTSHVHADPNQHDEEFKEILIAWKVKTEKAKLEKQRIEEETIATAKDLIEELKRVITTEENIGKAFLGFNAIKDKWRELPKVSNDHYRDLNAEYNKQVELFFYNINIYKELKELDLKHNLEEKTRVLEDQKKLLNENDVRLLEVEVRLNQDRWNDIGPTHQEHWNTLKDEFWNVTREIYTKIHTFYNQRREEQGKHVERKLVILERAKHIAALELRNPKKWQEKTDEMLEIQKEWNLVGFISKDVSAPLWKEFRSVCNVFFNNKRAYYEEVKKAQEANRLAKQALLDKADSLKSDQNWKETTLIFTNLQKSWKEIGPAHQRDENKLWNKFREACDQFFESRKTSMGAANVEQKTNLDEKLKLIEFVKSIETTDRKTLMDTLQETSEKWRKIGHVPFKEKDKVNEAFRLAVDAKYDSINMDKRAKEKLRFEQRIEDFKDSDNSDRFLRKEQDILFGKIAKIQSEITLLENNMGFFAASKGAEKFKIDIQRKIDKGREEIAELRERMKVLKQV